MVVQRKVGEWSVIPTEPLRVAPSPLNPDLRFGAKQTHQIWFALDRFVMYSGPSHCLGQLGGHLSPQMTIVN